MKSMAQLATTMQHTLGKRANKVGRDTGFMEREDVLTGSSFVVGLVAAGSAEPAASLAWQGANTLFDRGMLIHELHSLTRTMACCRMDLSQQHPRAFQLLEPSYA